MQVVNNLIATQKKSPARLAASEGALQVWGLKLTHLIADVLKLADAGVDALKVDATGTGILGDAVALSNLELALDVLGGLAVGLDSRVDDAENVTGSNDSAHVEPPSS